MPQNESTPRWGSPSRGANLPPELDSCGMLGRSATAGQGVLDGRERGVGVLAQGRDGADAHHDDQGEHDRVLDGGRAVFGLDELDQVLRELTHDNSPVTRWCGFLR